MNYWKLGTNWGTGAPDFHEMIKHRGIILSHLNDGSPQKGDIMLITRGFTVKAIAEILEDTKPVTDDPSLEIDFKKHNIDYHQDVLFAKAKWVQLKDDDYFWYQNRNGISRVWQSHIIKQTKLLLEKYANPINEQPTLRITSIHFQNYKAFAEEQCIKLKPITILIGKNSSGKSSIAKLLTLLENSFSKKIDEPLLLNNNGVELGSDFSDLFFGKNPNIPLKFSIKFNENTAIKVSLIENKDMYGLDVLEWSYTSIDKQFFVKFSPETGYIDAEGNQYSCKFKGFLPIEIINLSNGNNIVNEFNIDIKIDVDYIGPFRILPQRKFYLSGKILYKDTGVKGENAYPMLGISKLRKEDLHEKVGKWYKDHLGGWELIINDKDKPYIEILLSKNTTDVNIVDVGQGMNQALPLVVRAFENRPESIIVLEQPELHLHPAAHAELAELFARSAKNYNQTFIIETHSENMLLRLRKLVIDNDFGFTKDDVVIYWVDDAESQGQQITAITIDEEGILSHWPEGVFTENVAEILAMRKVLKNKKQRSENDNKIQS